MHLFLAPNGQGLSVLGRCQSRFDVDVDLDSRKKRAVLMRHAYVRTYSLELHHPFRRQVLGFSVGYILQPYEKRNRVSSGIFFCVY